MSSQKQNSEGLCVSQVVPHGSDKQLLQTLGLKQQKYV